MRLAVEEDRPLSCSIGMMLMSIAQMPRITSTSDSARNQNAGVHIPTVKLTPLRSPSVTMPAACCGP
ncbi:hypothetical protein D3C78_1351160 [compost metagenome]